MSTHSCCNIHSLILWRPLTHAVMSTNSSYNVHSTHSNCKYPLTQSEAITCLGSVCTCGVNEDYLRSKWGLHEVYMRITWRVHEDCMMMCKSGLYEEKVWTKWGVNEDCMRSKWGLFGDYKSKTRKNKMYKIWTQLLFLSSSCFVLHAHKVVGHSTSSIM